MIQRIEPAATVRPDGRRSYTFRARSEVTGWFTVCDEVTEQEGRRRAPRRALWNAPRFLHKIAFNGPGPREMATIRRPIRRGTHLTPYTPSRCDRGGSVNPSLPYAQSRIEFAEHEAVRDLSLAAVSTRLVSGQYRPVRGVKNSAESPEGPFSGVTQPLPRSRSSILDRSERSVFAALRVRTHEPSFSTE